MLSLGAARPDEPALVRSRIEAAVRRRQTLGLPAEYTTAFRLVHGEGDLLPGLIVDRLGAGVVVQLGTAAWARLQDVVFATVRDLVKPEWMIASVPQDAASIEGLAPWSRVVHGDEEALSEAYVVEAGVKLAVEPLGGQKTGFYADQRDNRRRVAELSRGKNVLDAFCHAGGFGLHALMGGATAVTLVDTSPRAIALAQRSAALNGRTVEAIAADAMVFLKEEAPRRSYDLIVIDPPKFARSRAHTEDALRKYRRLNESALAALGDGGLLVTCSCSGHVSSDDFLRMIADAAFTTGRHLHVLEERGQAADHPFLAACPEGRYLKCVIAQVSSR
jgi:23S rRNA (cytosine1962-C5)-methyltransferase